MDSRAEQRIQSQTGRMADVSSVPGHSEGRGKPGTGKLQTNEQVVVTGTASMDSFPTMPRGANHPGARSSSVPRNGLRGGVAGGVGQGVIVGIARRGLQCCAHAQRKEGESIRRGGMRWAERREAAVGAHACIETTAAARWGSRGVRRQGRAPLTSCLTSTAR